MPPNLYALIVLALIAVLVTAEVLRAGILAPMRTRVRGRTSTCCKCGYDLCGLASPGRCPECATDYASISRVQPRVRLDWRRCWLGPACFAVAMGPQPVVIELLRRWWLSLWEDAYPGRAAPLNAISPWAARELHWPLAIEIAAAIMVILVCWPQARTGRLLTAAALTAVVFAAAHTAWLPVCWNRGAWTLMPMPWWWAVPCVAVAAVVARVVLFTRPRAGVRETPPRRAGGDRP